MMHLIILKRKILAAGQRKNFQHVQLLLPLELILIMFTFVQTIACHYKQPKCLALAQT